MGGLFRALDEARIGRRLQTRLGLGHPTTVRKRVLGYEVWFQSDHANMPGRVRTARVLANKAKSFNDAAVQTAARDVVKRLPQGAKLQIAKFKGISSLLLSGAWENAVVLDRDKTQPERAKAYKQFGRFAAEHKLLETLDHPELVQLCLKHAEAPAKSWPDEQWEYDYRAAILEVMTDLFPKVQTSWLGLFPRENLLCHNNGFLPHLRDKGLLTPERLRREIAEEMFQDIARVGHMLNEYYDPVKESAVPAIDSALTDALRQVTKELAYKLVEGDPQFDPWELFQLAAAEAQTRTTFVDGETIRAIRMAGDGSTLDRLARFLVKQAQEGVSRAIGKRYGSVGAGLEAHDPEFFARLCDRAERAAGRCFAALQAMGVRSFVKPAVLFSVRDWAEVRDGQEFGGWHVSGNRTAPKPPEGQEWRTKDKNDHWVQVYVTPEKTEEEIVRVLAHEVGHAVYNYLPDDQQQWVLQQARAMPVTKYGRTDYEIGGRVGYSHKTGNEWFAELLSLHVLHPDLLRKRAMTIGTPAMSGRALMANGLVPNTSEVPKTTSDKEVNQALTGFKRAFYQATPSAAAGYKPGLRKAAERSADSPEHHGSD